MQTHILLSHHFINTIYHSNMLKPLQEHLQVVHLIHSNGEVNKPNVLHILSNQTSAILLCISS